ncbi:MAG: hypothetical protein WBI10_06725 [Syntrophales bacterium]
MMDQKSISIRRHELYKLVWSEPISRLARKYGYSDVWLAKICRRYNIPRPGRGYWARKQAGERVPTTPLPKKHDDPLIEISVRPPTTEKKKNGVNNAPLRPIPKTIAVPELLTNPHPLVEKSAQVLETGKPNRAGIVVPSKGNCLDVRVSRDCLDRELRIMDALLKDILRICFDIYVKDGSTLVNIDGVSVGISVSEDTKRRRMKAAEHDLDGYYRFGYNLYSDRAIPSGSLSLAIDDIGFPYGTLTRKTWRDTETNRLEDSLRSFISGLIKAAGVKKSLEQKKAARTHTPENLEGHETS